MNLLILDISYKIKIIQHLVLLWLASVKWKHDFMGHPCQSMFSGMSCPSYVYSPCFPRHLLSRDICLRLRLYNTKDIYCLFHIHFLRNSITFLHVSLLHCNAGYHTVCTATVTQGFIHSRALTNVQWSLVFVMSALQHHRIQEPPKRFIALRSSLCIALYVWSFSGAEMPDGISQVEHLWHEKKTISIPRMTLGIVSVAQCLSLRWWLTTIIDSWNNCGQEREAWPPSPRLNSWVYIIRRECVSKSVGLVSSYHRLLQASSIPGLA